MKHRATYCNFTSDGGIYPLNYLFFVCCIVVLFIWCVVLCILYIVVVLCNSMTIHWNFVAYEAVVSVHVYSSKKQEENKQ